jgi:hypothetical protein
MTKFIYDDKQKKSVNLENVDTIQLDDKRNEYTITFEKQLSVKDTYVATTLARWSYTSKEERDHVFQTIIADGGKRVGYFEPLVV